MVNLIWALLAIVGIVYAAFNGTMKEVNQAIFQTLDEAVMITISLAGVLVFWIGLMKIAEEAGTASRARCVVQTRSEEDLSGYP